MNPQVFTAFGETDTLIHLIDEFNPYTDIESVQYWLARGYSVEEAIHQPCRDFYKEPTEAEWNARIKSHMSTLNGVWK